MRILIDECAPRALRDTLAQCGHQCRTVQDQGWAGKKNGELLNLAENAFDVLVTIDTNLRYQQNLTGRKIAILLLSAPTNRLDVLAALFPACVQSIATIKPGDFVEIDAR